MAVVRVLLEAERRNARRAARTKGAWKSADRGMLIFLFAVFVFGQVLLSGAVIALQSAAAPASGLGIDTPALARMLLDGSLVNVLAGWLLIPILARGLLVRGRSVSPSHLLQYPVSVSQLLAFSVVSTLTSGMTIGMAVVSAIAVAPLLAMPHAVAGLVGALLFVIGCVGLSWAIGLTVSALFSVARGRELGVGLAAGILLLVVTPVLVGTSRTPDGIELHAFGGEALLISKDGTRGVVPALQRVSPARAVITLATSGWSPAPLGVLVLLAGGSAAVSALAFRRSLVHPAQTGAPRHGRTFSAAPFTSLPFLRDPLRACAEKELAFLLQTMDAPLVALVGVVATVVALTAETYWWIAVAMLPFMAINELAIPTNAFGLDRGGVDRYLLAPLTSLQVLLSKNVAWAWLIAWQSLPVVIALAARHGARIAAAAVAGQAAYVLLMTAWGNVMSVRSPAPREFWNFDSPQQAGGIASQVVLGLGGAALVLAWRAADKADALAGGGGPLRPVAMVGLAAGAALAWNRTLHASARELARNPEGFRARLAA